MKSRFKISYKKSFWGKDQFLIVETMPGDDYHCPEGVTFEKVREKCGTEEEANTQLNKWRMNE